MSALPKNRRINCAHYDGSKCPDVCDVNEPVEIFNCQGCAAYYPKTKSEPIHPEPTVTLLKVQYDKLVARAKSFDNEVKLKDAMFKASHDKSKALHILCELVYPGLLTELLVELHDLREFKKEREKDNSVVP